MDVETQSPCQQPMAAQESALRRWVLLLLSVALMVLGGLGGPLFTRMYFLHGGARVWLTSMLQNAGFPIVLLYLAASYSHRRGRGAAGVFSVTGRGGAACVAFGVFAGLNAFMYAKGSASLPVSTSSLLISTQMAFTAGFAFLIVGQRFTAYSVNAVVLLVMGPVVLGLQSRGDRPAGESRARYYLGFFMTLGSAVLIGLLMPLIELTRLRMKRKVTDALVMEMQLIIAVSATAFCVVAMLINKDFQAIPREAKEYGLGETKYYLVLAGCAVLWQLLNIGFVGVISSSSSLFAGVVLAVTLPGGQILPVLLLHEKFNSGKGVALALCLWGFTSYLYGEYRQHKKLTEVVAGEGLELPAAP